MNGVLKKILFILSIYCINISMAAAGKITVFVSIAPQKFFVQQIGMNLVDVRVMVQPDGSPATYEPKPRQMTALSRASAYFAVGVPFENTWLKKIAAANPNMKIIHTDKGIRKMSMSGHHDHDENGHHHGEDEHGHDGKDPHTWLSPALVKIQARTILSALREMDPSHAAEFKAGYDRLVSKIDVLDRDLKKMLADKKGQEFMVFHPSWGYFARDYGLVQVPIEIQGKNPKPAQLKELIEHAREKGIQVVFAQPQFSAKSAGVVAREIKGRVVFADPLAEDWPTNLRKVGTTLKSALK